MACSVSEWPARPAVRRARIGSPGIVAMLAYVAVLSSGPRCPLTQLFADEPPAATVRPLAADLDRVNDLAIAPNGQRLYALNGDGEQLFVVDVGRSASGTVAPLFQGASPDGPAIGIGCIDGSTVALLHRGSSGAVLTTHRLPSADARADLAQPLQRTEVTAKLPADARGCLAVSPSRDWLAVTGVDERGQATVLRAAIARVRIGPASPRHSPVLPAGSRLLAAAISPSEDLVLAYRPAEETVGRSTLPSSEGDERLSMHAMLGGHTLLDLDTGLTNIRDICVSLGRGTLWVLTGEAGQGAGRQAAGLWRLDAVIRDRRQAVQPRLMTTLDDPQAVVASGDELLYVVDQGGRRLLEVRPAAQAAASSTP